jgi:hypothetical protein
VHWLEAGILAGPTGLRLDTSPSIPHGLPGNDQGLCAVPVPSGSQSPGPGRQNVPECREQYGVGGGGPQEAGQRSESGAGLGARGDSGTCDLIR